MDRFGRPSSGYLRNRGTYTNVYHTSGQTNNEPEVVADTTANQPSGGAEVLAALVVGASVVLVTWTCSKIAKWNKS